MERKINLFVDAHSFDKEYQGVRTFIKEIYNIFLERYPKLEIFFGAANIEQIQRDFPLAKQSNIIRYKHSLPFFRFFYDIPSIIRQYQIEFAHFQYMVPFGKKRCKYIVTAHDILFNDFKSDFSKTYRYTRNFLFKKGIKEADIKTTVSDYSKQRIEHYYKIDSNRIHVIPNGVNENFGKHFSLNQQAADYIFGKYNLANYILYVSRIEPRKNHLALITAYINCRLFENNIPLVFIGKESIPVNELKEYINKLTPHQKRFIFWFEQVDQNDLEAFYKGCKVFVYPSKAEGFGIPPLEAAISKVPVICSAETAMAEYDFFTPYLFNPYDQNELECKLDKIIKAPPDALSLEHIATQVLNKYSGENSAEKLYNLIVSH